MREILENFSLRDALGVARSLADFAIVLFLIYQLLLIIRGTRAVQLLVTLTAIVMGYFLSGPDYFDLSTLRWLLDKFMASIIIVFVILFQQDIRRGLASLALASGVFGASAERQAQRVEELVRACVALAQQRIGGLIVVERRGDLSNYAEEAVQLDALLSREALFAIFNPTNANPLHDGAVILRDGRVVCAGAFLPLTSNPRVPKHLGTRHRAAIGLSEDTDAVVVVVSEETGAISVAVNGSLHLGLSANSLRERLLDLLGQRPETSAASPAAGAAA
jgi:diadenylate cyclase